MDKQRKSGIAKVTAAVVGLPTIITAVIWYLGYIPSLPFYAPVRMALVTQSKPSLSDPLSMNSDPFQWDVGTGDSSFPHGSCQFTGGAYDAQVTLPYFIKMCVSAVSVRDFALQVQMKIIEGVGGGLLFRESVGQGTSNNFYYFYIESNGSYGLIKSVYPSAYTQTLYDFSDPVIKTGLNARNELTVLMIGDTIYLFANGKYLVKIVDSSLSQGQIGVAAGVTDGVAAESNRSTVAFSNLKMWHL